MPLEIVHFPPMSHDAHASVAGDEADFLSTRNLRDDLALFTALRDGRQDLVPKGIDG